MIYGDIPFENDEEIVNCKLDFNKFKKMQTINNSGRQNNQTSNYYNSTANRCTCCSTLSSSSCCCSDVNDLIKSCLNFDPNKRIQLDNILEHAWFNDLRTN